MLCLMVSVHSLMCQSQVGINTDAKSLYLSPHRLLPSPDFSFSLPLVSPLGVTGQVESLSLPTLLIIYLVLLNR